MFKVGDIVRRINIDWHDIKIGDTGVVARIEKHYPGNQTVWIEGRLKLGDGMSSRFLELVKPNKRDCTPGCEKENKHDTCHVYSSPLVKTENLSSVKHDQDKVDPTFLTWELVEEVCKVRAFGAKKYGRNNYKITGFKFTRSLAAALRHIFAFLGGQDNDPESGYSHLAHAVCCLEHCLYDLKHHPSNDDRGQV